ncbi:MAG: prephenate dehydrogenase [Verrucomicrobia bacterium]|nr:prephenate dehydrogenase [Verrucomicrobiota bacterium]
MSDTVAILGLGLMGGSLGLALRRLEEPRPAVRGFARRPETCDTALSLGVVDEAFTDPMECCAGADMIVLCVPILAMPDLVDQCLPGIKAGALVTDVGSTKVTLCKALGARLRDANAVFVGSHPIAGSEEYGLEASHSDLYQGALVVVTPGLDTSAKDVEKTIQFWKQLHACVVSMTPEEHDKMLARTSHLPHLVAAVLTQSALRKDGVDASSFCGRGFRDTTRVAAGTENIWEDIVQSNREAILEELDAMAKELGILRSHVVNGQGDAIRMYLREARVKRQALGEKEDGRQGPRGGANE